jgi:hypothetical protein
MRILAKWPVISSLILIALTIHGRASAQAADTGPTLTETIAYINSHIAPATISLSADQSELTLASGVRLCGKKNEYTCGNFQTFAVRWASSMKIKTTGGDVSMSCPRDSKCMEKHGSVMEHVGFNPSWNAGLVDAMILVGNSENPEMNERLGRAAQRLLDLLTDQVHKKDQQENEKGNDPFKVPSVPNK